VFQAARSCRISYCRVARDKTNIVVGLTRHMAETTPSPTTLVPLLQSTKKQVDPTHCASLNEWARENAQWVQKGTYVQVCDGKNIPHEHLKHFTEEVEIPVLNPSRRVLILRQKTTNVHLYEITHATHSFFRDFFLTPIESQQPPRISLVNLQHEARGWCTPPVGQEVAVKGMIYFHIPGIYLAYPNR
jgi:hypothetical protein